MSDSTDWIDNLRGRFLVFDGPDGSGKTTMCRRFAQAVEAAGVKVCAVREPGGTAISEQIRALLLDVGNDDIDPRCEMLLYMASRAQLIAQRIVPALKNDELVLADRFISSTLAYQGTAGGLDHRDILEAGRIALNGCWPDLVVIFDIDEQTAAERLTGKPKRKKREANPVEPGLFSDRMESKGLDYHRAVRQGYLQQVQAHPEEYLVIDASKGTDRVYDELLAVLRERIVDLVGYPGKATDALNKPRP